MGPWACVSVCQAAWSTDGHTEAHLLSLSLLHILSFPDRTLVVFWTFLVIFLCNSAASLKETQPSFPSLSWIFSFLFLGFSFFFFSCLTVCSPVCKSIHHFPPALLFLFLPPSTVPSLLVCGFWAMLSSPTVILQPYGLPVYPQTTTCYPSIVQVKTLLHLISKLSCLVFTSLCCYKSSLSATWELWRFCLRWLRIQWCTLYDLISIQIWIKSRFHTSTDSYR